MGPFRTTRSWITMILLAGLAGLGIWLAFGGLHGDGRGVAWRLRRSERFNKDLQGLAENLRDYHEAHGRYPTNDEGLAALDTWTATHPLQFGYYPEENYFGRHSGLGEILATWPWIWTPGRVAELVENQGSPQAALEEIALMADSFYGDPMDDEVLAQFKSEGQEMRETTLAVDKANRLYVLGPAGPISPRLLPYVYENRNGLDASVFAGSHATDDEPYAVKVDEGVYVWSLGGREAWQDYRKAWWSYNLPRMLGGAILAAVVAILVIAWLRKSDWRGRYILAAGLGLLGIGVTVLGRATCYIMASGVRRNPEITAQRRALLDTYHNNGVIGEEAYRRAVEAIENIGRAPKVETPESDGQEGSSNE